VATFFFLEHASQLTQDLDALLAQEHGVTEVDIHALAEVGLKLGPVGMRGVARCAPAGDAAVWLEVHRGDYNPSTHASTPSLEWREPLFRLLVFLFTMSQ
jgi:hypothetical protein